MLADWLLFSSRVYIEGETGQSEVRTQVAGSVSLQAAHVLQRQVLRHESHTKESQPGAGSDGTRLLPLNFATSQSAPP